MKLPYQEKVILEATGHGAAREVEWTGSATIDGADWCVGTINGELSVWPEGQHPLESCYSVEDLKSQPGAYDWSSLQVLDLLTQIEA